jgi:hypothetical protein
MVMAHPATTSYRPNGRVVPTATRALARTGALILTLALLLVGCSTGGSPRPGGYQCIAAPSQYGCWTQLSITPTHVNSDGTPDIPGLPVGAQSGVLITPLSCDAACRASSGGGGNPPGFIANFMQLWQSSNNWFIRVGYETTPSSGAQYFVQWGVGDFSPSNGTVPLGLTQIEPGFTGDYPYTNIFLGQVTHAASGPQVWNAYVGPNFPPTAVPQGVGIGPTAFQPDYLFSGQVVYGTSGATAIISGFTGTHIYTASGFQALQEDGVPPNPVRTADHPTDAGWLSPPSSSGSDGGIFYVSCCQL